MCFRCLPSFALVRASRSRAKTGYYYYSYYYYYYYYHYYSSSYYYYSSSSYYYYYYYYYVYVIIIIIIISISIHIEYHLYKSLLAQEKEHLPLCLYRV